MGGSQQQRLEPALIQRFARDLDALVDPQAKIGVAVSGGPDSVALLILAAAARPKLVEAATIDHALRPESRGEAEFVATVSAGLGVPHQILTVQWDKAPQSRLQELAREKRYELLSTWANDRGLTAVLTGHHQGDQAETLLMRLARGAGVGGLASMRPRVLMPNSRVPLARPLLGWSVEELAALCASGGIAPILDPSNADERFERVRLRKALGEADWLPTSALAASAANLADADEGLVWATSIEWGRAVEVNGATIAYAPTDAPPEIRRRIVSRAIAALASEGDGAELRGREVDQVMTALASGATATLRGVLCKGGDQWRFSRAPERRA